MSKKPYVNSNFARRLDDDYKTVDDRCVYAFLEHFQPRNAIDVCSPKGSGIVTTMKECGYSIEGIEDAFSDNLETDWIVSNPPYTKGLVDKIIWRQIERIKQKEIIGVAMLLRNNFDYAKTRQDMFRRNIYYYGKIKMLFRPKWLTPEEETERKLLGEKIHGPIHNFDWHVWTSHLTSAPTILYSDGKKSNVRL